MAKRKAIYNPEADAKWASENKEHKNYLRRRSDARSFIRSKATLVDLDELETLIAVRRDELERKTASQDCARAQGSDGVDQ